MSFLHALGRSVPTILTFTALAGLFWWGHQHGWAFARPAGETHRLATDHWCPEHHVPEDACLLCRKPVGAAQVAREPDRHRASGEEVRFAQVASTSALAKAGIHIATVTLGEVTPRLSVAGETRYPPTAITRLGYRSDSLVRALRVQLGMAVAPGTVVAVLDVAEVGRAKSTLLQALSALGLAQGNAQRIRITAAAGVRSAADLQEVETRLRAAEIAVFDAEQHLRNLGLPVDAQALIRLEPAVLTERVRRLGLPDGFDDGGSASLVPLLAPHGGTITDIGAVTGEAVEANHPILVMADASRLWLSLSATPDQAARIRPEQTVAFTTTTGIAAAGAIEAVSTAADLQTRLVPVWVRLDNGDGSLRAGLFGTAHISIGTPIRGALVPMGALQFDGDQAYVFVRRTDTIFRCLPVRVLARDGDQRVVDRLDGSDAIAVSGTGVLFSAAFPERMGAGCTDGH
jgi:cobalt-zinc-cadmium efflux system membrane fusion protein